MKKPCSNIWRGSVKLLTLCSLLLLFACGEGSLDSVTDKMKRGIPDESSENVSISEYNGKKLSFVLKAGRIDRWNDKRIMHAYKVDIISFDSEGGSSSLKADSTIVDDARNIVFAYGNVKLVGKEGSVSSQRLIWDRNTDEVTAPDAVTLTKGNNVLRGRNLRTTLSIYPTEMENVSAEGFFEESVFDW